MPSSGMVMKRPEGNFIASPARDSEKKILTKGICVCFSGAERTSSKWIKIT